MQQLITFLLFKIKKQWSMATVVRDKRSTKDVTIFLYTYRGYRDIDFIKKFVRKKLKKL